MSLLPPFLYVIGIRVSSIVSNISNRQYHRAPYQHCGKHTVNDICVETVRALSHCPGDGKRDNGKSEAECSVTLCCIALVGLHLAYSYIA